MGSTKPGLHTTIITSQVLGAILAVIDFGMGLKEAIDAPRGKTSQKYFIL
jgi:hypothetical protein